MENQSGIYKSLGFPSLTIHKSNDHFDFTVPSRTILVTGPIGSGKTEFAAQLWRDAEIARKKGRSVAFLTSGGGSQIDLFEPDSGIGTVDRRNTFFVRYVLEQEKLKNCSEYKIPYRGGFIDCGTKKACISNSFELEELIKKNPNVGTWIIDEAAFYDERLAYLVKQESEQRGLVFVMPSLLLNFRGEVFNQTARLLMETSTEIYPITAYCEHKECLESASNTYRYYLVDGVECPALFFDPLIIIANDEDKNDSVEPNYCTRCDIHHYVPGKEYAYFTLKPLGELASIGNIKPLETELKKIKTNLKTSELYLSFKTNYSDITSPRSKYLNALKVPLIAERALIYLYAEQNLLSLEQTKMLIENLELDKEYLVKRLIDNRRPIEFNSL